LYQPTLANTASSSVVFGVLYDLTSFENWFRCMHNACMMQLIIDGSLQTFKRLYDAADSSGESESEILHIFKLFRPLACDIVDETDHNATRCPSRIFNPEKCDYIMVPELSNQFSVLVDQVMMKQTDDWQSSLTMKTFAEAQKSPAGEATKFDNCV